MKYDEVFGFYNPETREGSIYDGSKRKDRKLSNGVIGFSIEPVWRGKCTEAELIEKAKQYEKTN